MWKQAADAQPFLLAAALWAAFAAPLWVLEWAGLLPSCAHLAALGSLWRRA